MTNYKLSALTNAVPAAADLLPFVDVDDNATAPAGSGGSDKQATVTQLGAALPAPLWAALAAGENTIPRGHQDDSGSFGATPASGVLLLTLFRARTAATYQHVNFQTGGTAQSGNTLSKAGVYSVDGSGNMTLLSGCTSTTFPGTFTSKTVALTSSVTTAIGSIYAIGILQVGTTSASLLGAWFNGMFLGTAPVFAQTIGSQSDLPASITAGSLSTSQFPVYCELVA